MQRVRVLFRLLVYCCCSQSELYLVRVELVAIAFATVRTVGIGRSDARCKCLLTVNASCLDGLAATVAAGVAGAAISVTAHVDKTAEQVSKSAQSRQAGQSVECARFGQ